MLARTLLWLGLIWLCQPGKLWAESARRDVLSQFADWGSNLGPAGSFGQTLLETLLPDERYRPGQDPPPLRGGDYPDQP